MSKVAARAIKKTKNNSKKITKTIGKKKVLKERAGNTKKVTKKVL
jgi:hypothetical protein